MGGLVTKAILAGVFFGIWPLVMNRSGLNGNVASAVFSTVVLIGVLPFALYGGGFPAQANWTMAILAGVLGALGLLAFNSMLHGATLQTVGTLFVLMTIVQISVAALYQVVINGQLTIDKIVGFIAAIIAAFLLLR